jgi:hypothetical protein
MDGPLGAIPGGPLEAVTSDKYPSPPGAGGESWYFGIDSRSL